MPDKQQYVDQMRDLVSTTIRWDKLPKEDLAVLVNFFSNPKMVIISTLEGIEDEEEKRELIQLVNNLATPEEVRVGNGGDGLLPDGFFENRPLLSAARSLVRGR